MDELVIPDADKEFYLQYGFAMSAWQIAEDSIFYIFADAIDSRGLRIAGIIYHAIYGFEVRLRIITDCLTMFLGDDHDLYKQWVELRKRAIDCWETRGAIAHPTLYVEYDLNMDQSGPPYIGRRAHRLTPKEKNRRIEVKHLKDHSSQVHKLGMDLLEYRNRLLPVLTSIQKSS